MKFVFFGTGNFSVKILEILSQNGFSPGLIITAPDKPKGRKMALTPPPAKAWALRKNISVEQPQRLPDIADNLREGGYDLFIVAAYGKIIPKEILEIPKHGTLNVHPSLLPKFRGPSPIQSFILSGEKTTGVTIMLLDEEMDHGPILAQRTWTSGAHLDTGCPSYRELGGNLLAEVIPKWLAGEIKPVEQDHSKATYCKKITKQDGLVSLNEPPEIIERKVRALSPWPGVYFFINSERIIITEAKIEKGNLKIKKIKPAGKKEMRLEDYLRGAKDQTIIEKLSEYL